MTCRTRRKKCDEQWEGESCRTCKRLEIECRRFGPGRPELFPYNSSAANYIYRAQIIEKLTKYHILKPS